jgi:hypothetical protein
MPGDTKLTSAAGEHHVCAELARREWAPSLTRDGLARTDILAVHTTTRAMIEVRVKTVRDASSWPLGRKGTMASISRTARASEVRCGHPEVEYVIPGDGVFPSVSAKGVAGMRGGLRR